MASGAVGFNSCVILPAIYSVNMDDTFGDGWNTGAVSVDGVVYSVPDSDGDFTTTSNFTQYMTGPVTSNVGSCPVYGCMDPLAANYDVTATVNETSSTDSTDPCTYGIPGCTDATACNFDAGATANDGSCTYAAAGFDCNGDCLVGDAVTLSLYDSYDDGWNYFDGTIQSLTIDGVDYTTTAGTVSFTLCLDLTACTFVTFNPATGWNDDCSWDVVDAFGAVIASGGPASGTVGAGCGVLGCADTAALNYDATADSCDGIVGGTDTSCCIYPPANDACSEAIAVICGDVVSGSTVNSTQGVEDFISPDCGVEITTTGVWYSFSSTGSEEVTFSLCGSAFDTKINVFSGTCGDFVCEGGNDDACATQSEVTLITSPSPTDYLIFVSGYALTGAFVLEVSCDVASCVPPVNDLCSGALPIPDGVAFMDDNVCAQANDLDPTCLFGFQSVYGVWYTWNSGANNALTLDFGPAVTPDAGDSAVVDPYITMYSGNCANPTEENCFNGLTSEDIGGLTINTTYYFLVSSIGDEVNQGQYDLMLTGGIAGCTTVGACDYDASATVDDGTCDLSCLGCTDSTATNFDPDATFDDGSCIFCTDNWVTITAGGGAWDAEITWQLLDGSGVLVASGAAETQNACLVDDCYTVNMFDSFGDGWNGAEITFTDAADNVLGSGTISSTTGATGTFDIGIGLTCPVLGCTDENATNYDETADTDDSSCLYLGCTDTAACNFDGASIDNGGFLTDDGTCCFTNCVTVTITDSAGNGGTSVLIGNELGTIVLASLTGEGSEISETFCIADECALVSISTDFNSAQAGVVITDQNGELLNFATGSISGGSTTTITVGAAVGCVVSGCNDATALNYNAAANADCLDVFGGTDVSCCVYPVANNDCDGAIALAAGVEAAWDTNNSDDSGNNCSPTLINDVWYTYTPTCDLEVTVTSSSNQGGQVAIWEGDCSALTLVECGPNEGLIGTTISAVLTAGVTYSIQTGSNADFGSLSTGTILLEEGLCRGCTYSSSPDYSADAFIDDGSCTFEENSCPGDFTGDGFISVSDLGGFLSAFGTFCVDED
jgi:hypothetical protein